MTRPHNGTLLAKRDAEEEAIAAPAVDQLVEQHERVLASIDRLTDAVEAASQSQKARDA